MSRRIAVVGSGYVGTVVAACFAHVGHSVVGLEVDPVKLDALNDARAPFYEPGLNELLAAETASGRLRFTDSYPDAVANSELIFICVGTPPRPDGSPNTDYVEQAVRSIAANIQHYHVIVNKSTVPVGTARWIRELLSGSVEPKLFSVASNPEFLREGDAIQDFLHPERVLIGTEDEQAFSLLEDLYRPIVSGRAGTLPEIPFLNMSPATAELAKYASNAFLATKISFANEMAHLCELVGADITDVTRVMGLDSRIGPDFLQAGLGWGGSCFGKDISALKDLASHHQYSPRLIEAAAAVNTEQHLLAVGSLLRELPTLNGARVALLGLSYKPNTDDLRDSPAVSLARQLIGQGATVVAFDPMVNAVPDLPELILAIDAYAAVSDADAVVVATAWPQFCDLDLDVAKASMKGNLLLDGRNCLEPSRVQAAGLHYVGIGRAAFVDCRTIYLPNDSIDKVAATAGPV